jgi:hypothetical protein
MEVVQERNAAFRPSLRKVEQIQNIEEKLKADIDSTQQFFTVGQGKL